MKSLVTVFILFLGLTAGVAEAASGPSTRPKDSWDDMQAFEYNIGRIAEGLNLCRRFGMAGDMRAIAELTPYGKLGMRKMRTFDGLRGCGKLAGHAEKLLEDKDKLMNYMKAKYDCSDGDCVER